MQVWFASKLHIFIRTIVFAIFMSFLGVIGLFGLLYHFNTYTFSFLIFILIFSGTREASFVHALSSAGVAHAVTRACSSGRLTQCGCDRTVSGPSDQGFEWSGCSDNIAFGIAFAKTFVDAREKRKRKNNKNIGRQLMNIHNNQAGRKVSLYRMY